MKQPQLLLHSLLTGTIVVGFFAIAAFATSPNAPEKKPDSRGVAKQKQAASSENVSPRKNNAAPDKRDPAISKERAEAAVRFARKHHPELAELLEGLRKSDNRNFQAGLRVLTRDSERIEKMGERKDERYAISLELWKLDSRIRLEIARLSMSPDEDFEPRLRPLMKKRQDARVRLLRMERRRTAERLARYDEQLKTLESKSDDLVSSEIDRLKKTMAARARTKNSRPQTSEDIASKETASTKVKRKSPKSKTSRPVKTPTASAD